MQQILYRDSPYIVLAYSNDLEAFNTAKWQGYAASPAKIGNVLLFPVRQRRLRELRADRAEDRRRDH